MLITEGFTFGAKTVLALFWCRATPTLQGRGSHRDLLIASTAECVHPIVLEARMVAPNRMHRVVPAIPRILHQIGLRESNYTAAWRANNPDFTYMLHDDAGCAAVIGQMPERVQRAYSALLQGAMLADVCRLALLLVHGGVYVETDVKLMKTVRLATVIPHWASMVSTERYNFEFIAAAPRHPFIEGVLHKVVDIIFAELTACRDHRICCRGSHHCIIEITGPKAYFWSMINVSRSLGCTNSRWIPERSHCQASNDSAVRNIHRCKDSGERTNPYRTTFCGIARHMDCRNSGLPGRRCSPTHYSRTRTFYNYSVAPVL